MLAVEEKEACFKRGPELTIELYRFKSNLTHLILIAVIHPSYIAK